VRLPCHGSCWAATSNESYSFRPQPAEATPCTILSGGHGTRPDLRQEKKGNPCLVVVGPAGNTMELASHEMKWMQEGGGSAGSHTSRVRHHDHRTSPLRRHRRDLLPPAGHGTRTGLFFFETTYGPSGAKAGEDRHRGPSLAPGGGRFPLMHTCKFVGCECVVVGLVPLGPN
jgi:hypothetical protein